MVKLYFQNTDKWEQWLIKNHNSETELWLIYFKKHTKKPCIPYSDSVKVALCYGWIDSLVKKLDDDSYVRKFSPRKDNSVWSETNKKRIEELIKEGKMKTPGMRLVEIAKQNGNWEKVIQPPKIETEISKEFQDVLTRNQGAKAFYDRLTKSQQKQFNMWINAARRANTKQKRLIESITLLNSGKKLGLK